MSNNDTSLVLRVCRADLTSQNNFQWPSEVGAVATAPDWKKNEECGNGLHGWLYGAGDHSCTSYYAKEGAKWLVLEVANDDLVMLGGKVKFPKATVRHIGDRKSATDYLLANCDRAKADNCIGAFVTVGDEAHASVGALGTATAGDYGTATAGRSGTATAGDSGTATAGEKGELRIRWWDAKNDRYRTEVAYVGENGIKPNVKYRLDSNHKFVEA